MEMPNAVDAHQPGLEILFEDDDLLVINKPAGLRVLPDGYHPELPSVRTLLKNRYMNSYIVHRLDKDTSGVLIVAKTAASHKELNGQFESRKISKEYHAVVISPQKFPSQLLVEEPLLVDGDRRHRTRVDMEHGKPAETEFFLIHQFQSAALVKACPKTGYTHQIRAHASFAGFPLLGDSLYSLPAEQLKLESQILGFSRVALHALSIRFHHPMTGEVLTFSAEYPADFSELLDHLNK